VKRGRYGAPVSGAVCPEDQGRATLVNQKATARFRPCSSRAPPHHARERHPGVACRVPIEAHASQRLHLEREAEMESRLEAVRTGATPVLPPVREREADRQ